jgi:phospholipid transport system substrate-binding protein
MINSTRIRGIAARLIGALMISAGIAAIRGNATGFLLTCVRPQTVEFACPNVFASATKDTLALLSVLVLPSAGGAAAAANSAPVAQVRATIAEASPIFTNRRLPHAVHDELLRVIANRHFDFDYMAELALGTHWQKLSPKQQRQFVRLFENYVLATYLTTFQNNTVEAASHALTENATYEDATTAAVRSDVRLPMVQEPLEVEYMLHKNGKRWKLYDIVTDNVSTIANYREQFNQIINSQGYESLIIGLKVKNLQPTGQEAQWAGGLMLPARTDPLP